jgi:hypothetical protein
MDATRGTRAATGVLSRGPCVDQKDDIRLKASSFPPTTTTNPEIREYARTPVEMSAPPQGMPPMLADGQDMGPNYYPPENDLTGGLPINLDSLRDGPPGSKPFYPYSTLIRYV